MTWPNGKGPMRPDDLAMLAALDQALDELAAGDVAASLVEGEAAILAAVAVELRVSVPTPPPHAAEQGRAAFLARAAEVAGSPVGAELPRVGTASPGATAGRRLTVRVLALAAALVVLAAVPAAAVAGRAEPGTALWPVRQAGQELRASLAGDPVRRAHLGLDVAEEYLAAGAGAAGERRKAMADRAEDLIEDALDRLDDVIGPRAAVERTRAERLLLAVRALEHPDRSGGGPGSGPGPGSGSGSGSGPGSGSGDDHSGTGAGGSSGDDRSGPGDG